MEFVDFLETEKINYLFRLSSNDYKFERNNMVSTDEAVILRHTHQRLEKIRKRHPDRFEHMKEKVVGDKIAEVKESAHTHSNKDVLDDITSNKITTWDGYSAEIQTVKDGLVGKKDTSSPNSTGEVFNNYGFNTASGKHSHAEGGASFAYGDYSHAESQSTASGDSSHAEGGATTASGNYSHAEGWKTTASGRYSPAEGDSTTASGSHSHAEGINTTASGNFSHAD